MGTKSNRRKFLKTVGVAAGATVLSAADSIDARMAVAQREAEEKGAASIQDTDSAIDFRYSPLAFQTSFCFPDDPHKSLVGQHGELRCGHPGANSKGLHWFAEVVGFSVLGMEPDQVHYQRVEGPSVPIVHTRIDRPDGFLELTTFATNLPEEGRVDNVILEVVPGTEKEVHAVPQVILKSEQPLTLQHAGGASAIYKAGSQLFLLSDAPLSAEDCGYQKLYRIPASAATSRTPLRHFFRLPQEGQEVQKLKANLGHPDRLLASAREYWGAWNPLGGKVTWSQPERYGEFLVACARNILQAREMKNGRLNFQVGPTVYRGLWVVDGNFLLEAARYLGYDAEAQQGLEATWAWQRADGGVFAAVQSEHWKDTGIAMFSLVRQAELSQDWSYFRKMQPNVLRAVKFLVGLRDKAKSQGGTMGRYGLLPPGFGDGGLAGVRSEFTNTIWVLAGLRAVIAEKENFDWDTPILRFMEHHQSGALTSIMKIATDTGRAEVVTVLLLGVVIALLVARLRWHAAFLATATVLAMIMDAVLKPVFERPRPGVFPQLVPERYWSFPSGHTMSAMGFAVALAVVFLHTKRRRLVILAAVLYAVAVGVSRVYLGVHYPSDVVAGWALSLAVVAVVWLLFWNRLEPSPGARLDGPEAGPASAATAAAAPATASAPARGDGDEEEPTQ